MQRTTPVSVELLLTVHWWCAVVSAPAAAWLGFVFFTGPGFPWFDERLNLMGGVTFTITASSAVAGIAAVRLFRDTRGRAPGTNATLSAITIAGGLGVLLVPVRVCYGDLGELFGRFAPYRWEQVTPTATPMLIGVALAVAGLLANRAARVRGVKEWQAGEVATAGA